MTATGDGAEVTGRTVHQLGAGGEILDWLTSPAWATPCDDLDQVLDAQGTPWGRDGRWTLTNGPDAAELKTRLYRRQPLVTNQPLPTPVEGGKLRWTVPGGSSVDDAVWSRQRTGADGLVDWSRFCFVPEYRHALASVELEVDQAEWRTLEVASTGPMAVWIGDDLVDVYDDVSYMEPVAHRARLRLRSGTTRLLIATWQVAFREVRHVARVSVHGLPVRVVIPSPGADEYAAAAAEQLLSDVRAVTWALPAGVAQLEGPAGLALQVRAGGHGPVPVRLAGGRADLPVGVAPTTGATAASEPVRAAGQAPPVGAASMLDSGEVELVVAVDDPRCPIRRTLHVASLPPAYRAAPGDGDPQVWRREVLDHVAEGVPGTARALARTRLDDDAAVDSADLTPALNMLDARADCADFEAIGLMLAWHRIPPDRWPSRSRARVRQALTDFKYWIDQPGLDAMCYFTENHQLVWHTAETLVGEAFTADVFSNTGWRGGDHAEHGGRLVLEWINRKLVGGFSEFDSNAYLAIDSLALVALVELASDLELRSRAEALLDKMFLTLAANSWNGVHGAAHGRSYTPTLRSARFEETATIMRVLWGCGTLNAAVLPAAALATAQHYELPPVIRAVATAVDDWDGRQVYRGRYRDRHDLLERPYGSDLRVWRTRAGMLSSVQDYRSGLPGLQEHVWGATLSPEVQVFTTYPASSSHSSATRPNAWAGQRVLPRAHQHRDTVLVLHRLPHDDAAAQTHLWFPAPQMDEVVTAGPWLAGRLGDGFVAVAAEGGFQPATSAGQAAEEWLPAGRGEAYIATLGRLPHAQGSLAEFCGQLAEPRFTSGRSPALSWSANDGRELHLSWSGPFTVDGAPVDLDSDGRPERPPHISNPACRTEFGDARLVVEYAGRRLVLDLDKGRRIEPPTGVGADDAR